MPVSDLLFRPDPVRKPADTSLPRRALVAGVGNVLRCDDGFGPAVIQALEREPGLPAWVRTVEVGIGGIGLVLELIDGYEALVIVDAVDRGGLAGRLYQLEPFVPEVPALLSQAGQSSGMDMHEIGPGNALVIARALGVLPATLRLVGCQPAETDVLSTELSPPVKKTVPVAVQAVLTILKELYPEASPTLS